MDIKEILSRRLLPVSLLRVELITITSISGQGYFQEYLKIFQIFNRMLVLPARVFEIYICKIKLLFDMSMVFYWGDNGDICIIIRLW